MGLKVTVTHHPAITWSWSERVIIFLIIEDRYSHFPLLFQMTSECFVVIWVMK